MSESEDWRPYPHLPKYQVSDLGRVKGPYGRILKPRFNGYAYVVLSRWPEHAWTRKVGVMVLETFVGPRPASLDACHADDDQTNNCLDNLRWDTRQANIIEKYANRKVVTKQRGRVLSNEQVEEIRSKYAAGGVTQAALAKEYGVQAPHISKILSGKMWRIKE